MENEKVPSVEEVMNLEDNKDVLDEAEEIEMAEQNKLSEKDTSKEVEEDSDDDNQVDFEEEGFEIRVSDKSIVQKEKEFGVKKNMDGQILTVKSWKILPPKLYEDAEKTKKIEPKRSEKPSSSTGKFAEWYSTKLKVEFEENNIVEYIPGINIFLKEDGTLNTDVKLGILPGKSGFMSTTQTAQLGRLLLQDIAKKNHPDSVFTLTEALVNEKKVMIVPEADRDKLEKVYREYSELEILNHMIGKKFKIETSTGVFKNNPWFRNNLAQIVE